MTYLETLVAARDTLKAIDPANPPSHGMCNLLLTVLPDEPLEHRHARLEKLLDALRQASETWPEFSGDPKFPVPGPVPGMGPVEPFFWSHPSHAGSPNYIPRYTGPYGESRLRLRDHWVAALDKTIADLQNEPATEGYHHVTEL